MREGDPAMNRTFKQVASDGSIVVEDISNKRELSAALRILNKCDRRGWHVEEMKRSLVSRTFVAARWRSGPRPKGYYYACNIPDFLAKALPWERPWTSLSAV